MTGQPVVLDASVVLKWFTPEVDDEICLRLLERKDLEFHAPTLLATQFGGALQKRVKAGQMAASAARRAARTLGVLPIRWHSDADLTEDAVKIATATARTYNEATYLALCVRLQATWVVADRRWALMVAGGPLKDWVAFVDKV